MAPQTPNSRPVQPCYLSVWDGVTGAEYATWANITGAKVPDLVTAQGSSIKVYSLHEPTGKLLLKHSFGNLAGNVCYLDVLQVDNGADSLLVGFAGYPRLSVVSLERASTIGCAPKLLLATSLLDFTSIVIDNSFGSTSPLEQDLMASLFQTKKSVTLTVILGGGVAVASVQLYHHSAATPDGEKPGWMAGEPFTLPLQSLCKSTQKEKSNPLAAVGAAAPIKDLTQSITTGFGDIVDVKFLTDYKEPTMLILHSGPHGRTWEGRLGREDERSGTPYGLVATAVSVTVNHKQSAVLWSVQVPSDALQIQSMGKQGSLVICANSIVAISNAGQIQQCLAVNGWVRSTLPHDLMDVVQSNPWPFPRLAIQLDGSKICQVNEKTALIALRGGQLYLLQRNSSWCMLPLYQTIGSAGQVSNLLCWPFQSIPADLSSAFAEKAVPMKSDIDIGLVFVGSRLGDSTLLGYAMEQTSVADAIENGKLLASKEEETGDQKEGSNEMISEYEQILRLEEDALYAPSDESGGPNIIPMSSDDEQEARSLSVSKNGTRKRARLSQLTVFRALTVLDSLISTGPLGPGCEGPITKAPNVAGDDATIAPSLGATAYLFPCGYGSSGGLAVMSVPGRDTRPIMAEEDCINAEAVFCLRGLKLAVLAFLPENGGVRFMKVEGKEDISVDDLALDADIQHSLVEVDLATYCSTKKLHQLLSEATLLQVMEIDSDSFAIVTSTSDVDGAVSYEVHVLTEKAGKLKSKSTSSLPVPDGAAIETITTLANNAVLTAVNFAYTLNTGDANLAWLDSKGKVKTKSIPKVDSQDMEQDGQSEEELFYKDGSVVAVDIFVAPSRYFITSTSMNAQSESSDLQADSQGLGDEDAELYGHTPDTTVLQSKSSLNQSESSKDFGGDMLFLAICRQTGDLEIYDLEAMKKGRKELDPVWKSKGCGHGVIEMRSNQHGFDFRNPRMHMVSTRELRLFTCGPSSQPMDVHGPRPFCLVIETSLGDTLLYSASIESGSLIFEKIPLSNSTRPSLESVRHFTKLKRKKIVSESVDGPFRRNRLHPFSNLSGQDGLFAAVARPLWFVAERGLPVGLAHRCRHVAPAGARSVPVSGFAYGLQAEDGSQGFLTLHDRVGRVGSQRLTLFNSILDFSRGNNILPGGGVSIEKFPLGVTVRHIEFIDDPSSPSGSHPLYAVIVSREYDEDLSNLNDDGLTEGERERIKQEKEDAQIKRQVEADLGGYDLDQEWVEEIERENRFKVDMSLGGATPVPQRSYSLWIVDAANGWNVVDSFELEKFEHGLTMSVMHLTEFLAEPGGTVEESEEDLDTRLFITVGTGILDKNGEDVSSKGRVLLFQLNHTVENTTSRAASSSSNAELALVYEKTIFHGPVTTLSCLASEGKQRLIIGAGSDVNVEQWGNEKLTQVGFFRATIQILNIKLFKNFFVLSDAYDSLYFLVWRESDKSLTLLAKDYDPLPVYASGLMSRGGNMSIVCHDDRQNLQFFQYAPGDAAARGGNKLVCRADFHVGTQTTALQNYFCRSSLLVNSATPVSSLSALKQQDAYYGRTDDDQRIGIHFGTTDGSYGAVIPLSEQVYWRLTALQSVMVNAVESNCALSQRAWRMYRRSTRRGGCRSNTRKKGVIDGDLIAEYVDLPLADQEDLASSIGSSVEFIVDNILEIRCSTMVL